MSIVSALSKLLVKMGGTPAIGDTSDELVDKIADAYAPGGVLVVGAENNEEAGTSTLDKTWQEIFDAPFAVIKVSRTQSLGVMISEILYITDLEEPSPDSTAEYAVRTQIGQTEIVFYTSSADGYPVFVRE